MPRSGKQRKGRRPAATLPQCAVCEDLNPRPWNSISATELARSRDLGLCQSCILVSTAIEAFWPLHTLSGVALEFWRDNRHGRDQPRDALILMPCDENGPWGDEESGRTYVEVFSTHPQTPWPWISRPQRTGLDALSDGCIQLARMWLENCLSSHAQCGHSSFLTGHWLPTRLIDVGDEPTAPRLIESCSIDQDLSRHQYVALSHCWGKEQPLRLLKDNMSRFQQSIAPDLLPQTFLDAIGVVARLGIRYVWIDSLCIIQDSPEDWAHEATLMGDVYQNAVVTIVADAGKDAFAGLSSSGGRSEWCQRELVTEGSQHFVRRFSHPMYNNEKMDNHLATHGPSGNETTWVERRAWTYQERLLSVRKLYFGAHELGWECKVVRDCECCKGFSADYELNDKVAQRRALNFGEGIQLDDHVSIWKDLVENFATRDMSFRSDVLPAVAGLASVIGRKAGLTYLAGIWKEGLISMLLWALQAPSSDEGHEGYYAPSWSWASKVKMGLRLEQRYGFNIEFMPQFDENVECFDVPGLEIIDAACTYPQGNFLLPPMDGHIDIVGPVARLEQSHESTPEAEEPFTFPGPEMCVRLFLPDIAGDGPGSVRGEHELGAAYLFLPLQSSIATRIGTHPAEKLFLLLGLAIRGSKRVPGAFERVGYMECICEKTVMANAPAYVETKRKLKLI